MGGSDTSMYWTILVNMQYIPKITLMAGKWYRMRMVMSSTMDGVVFTAPSGCDLQLLAKDGVYLQDAPRSIKYVVIAPGNRADVAIKCDVAPGVYSMPIVSVGRFLSYSAPGKERTLGEILLLLKSLVVVEVNHRLHRLELPCV